MREILWPVINPKAHQYKKSSTVSRMVTDETASSKLPQMFESSPHVANGNKTNSLHRSKSLSANSFSKYQKQQHSAPPTSPVQQSKVDRLIKKLLKAGTDGDLGMVKFLLRWNQPTKGASKDVANATSKEKPITCHPLCDCDNCVKMVSKISSLLLCITYTVWWEILERKVS